MRAIEAKKMSVQIKATLKNTADKALSKKALMLQYFDVKKNGWTALADKLAAVSGKLDITLDVARLAKENPAGYETFKNAVAANTIPSLRLIDGLTASSDWTVVYGLFPVIYVTGEGVIQVDFGDLWVLDKYFINRHIRGSHPENEFAIGAFPRPNGNHALFPTLQAGFLNTEGLAGFKADEHEVRLIVKGEEIEEREDERIEELMNALREKEEALEAGKKRNEELQNELDKKDTKDDETDEGDYDLGEDGIKTKPAIAEPRPARDVYTTIVDEVKSASEKLEETPYSLANISLNLKTHVVTDEDGFKLQLIDAETAANAKDGTISEVKIDIGTKGNQTKGDAKQSAPNIIGLTETAARQRLKAFGLNMKVIYQTSKTKTIGQAFKQKPAPGEDITKGDTVITIFAKETEKFN